MHASGSMPLSLFFSLSGGKGMAGLTRGRTSLLPFHMHARADRSTFAWVPMCFFVLLFSLYSLCFSVRMCFDHFAHGFFSSLVVDLFFTFGFMLLFVLLSSAGKFCCTRAMLFYYFLPRTLRSLIFFRYSERVVSFTFFFSVVTFADFGFVLRYHVIFIFSH